MNDAIRHELEMARQFLTEGRRKQGAAGQEFASYAQVHATLAVVETLLYLNSPEHLEDAMDAWLDEDEDEQ